MACRDALLPFLETIPDFDLRDEYTLLLSPEQYKTSDIPFPYPNLEAAFQADAPGQVELLQMMCRDVSNEAILNRAVAQRKTAIVEFKLKTAPIEQKIEILMAVQASWEDPASLFRRFLPMFKDEIAAWRDPWGNGFFWYLYRCPDLSQTLIEHLPKRSSLRSGRRTATASPRQTYGRTIAHSLTGSKRHGMPRNDGNDRPLFRPRFLRSNS